ncbi:MAG: nucleoside-diphosphate-sugar epimerase [Lysobacterales bacterium]|jgi:nucleoside-diphosphate-sugar epimerase
MRVLVTGGGGFLGSAICAALRTRNDEVISYQRREASHLLPLGVYSIRGDLGNLEQLKRDSRGCDAVIHTAGKAGVWGDYESYYQANVLGTENVILACRANAIPNLVYTSSPSVVHGGGDIEGGDESLPYPKRFSSPYPATKSLGEQLVLAANNDLLKTTALRPHLIWGPGDPHLLPRLMAKAASGKLALPGGEKLIDTIYIENAAQAHIQALDVITQNGPACGKTYFISNDEPLPQAEIISRLLDAAGMPTEITRVAPWIAKTAGFVAQNIWKLLRLESEPPVTRWSAKQLSTAHWYDISAAKKDLGYTPAISIEEGLERLRQHFAES